MTPTEKLADGLMKMADYSPLNSDQLILRRAAAALRASTDRALTPALTADEIESLEALRDYTSEKAVLDYTGGKGRTASGKAVDAINRVLALLSPQDGTVPGAGGVLVHRWWLERVRESLQGDLPSGRIGDAVFLLRDMIADILEKPGSGVPTTMCPTEHPEHLYGFNAGVQAAWEVCNQLVNQMPAQPITGTVQTMRDTVLDVADNILDLKKRAPGEPAAPTSGERS